MALKDVADGISGRSDEFTPAMGANMAQGWVGFIKRCIELSGGKVDYVEIMRGVGRAGGKVSQRGEIRGVSVRVFRWRSVAG